MIFMGTCILVCLGVVGLGWLVVTRWVKRYLLGQVDGEIYFATTQDGWHLAMHRYVPDVKEYKEPILLCHGLASNRYIYTMPRERSLARYLAKRGFEVWILELRGAGLSNTPAWFYQEKPEIAFNHFIEKDVPAALELLGKFSHSCDVFWIGHGLGGLMGYAWIGSAEPGNVCGLITLGTSVVAHQTSIVGKLRPLLKMTPLVLGTVFRSLARLAAPLSAWRGFPVFKIFATRDGLENDMLGQWLVNAVGNSSGTLLRQFFGWIFTGEYGSLLGKVDGIENLSAIVKPVLIVAADGDRIAPPDTVEPAYRRITSADKQIRIFGTDRGDDHDFGHIDLLIGTNAPQMVYPELGDWLEKRATRNHLSS